MPNSYDVFISYAHDDQQWVRRLAENLHHAGLEVFLDTWRIGPGDVIVHALEDGILKSKNGIIVISPASLSSRWVNEEYAAMLNRTVEGKQKIIPVILKDAEIPPFLGTRLWVDFRHADAGVYEQQVRKLIDALKGKKPGPPPRIDPKPGTGFRPEGAFRCKLKVSSDEVSLLSGDDEKISHKPCGLTHKDSQSVNNLFSLRRRRAGAVVFKPDKGEGQVEMSQFHACLLEVGSALTRAFLVGRAGEELVKAVARAEGQNGFLELGLEVGHDKKLAVLPWETLRLPESGGIFGTPLVLHHFVNFYRAFDIKGEPAPLPETTGPLRILIAIGSPEAQTHGGEVLDYEKELGLILDSVEFARKNDKVFVNILERGTLGAISEALSMGRYHVLHISCHALPGALILENSDGKEDKVNAERLWQEALVPNRGVPLVVLAGCSTALPVSDESGNALPGLAQELLSHGVPAVIAMQATVSDSYSSELTAKLYKVLSTHENPDPLTALSLARRTVEANRQKQTDKRVDLDEWATPSMALS